MAAGERVHTHIQRHVCGHGRSGAAGIGGQGPGGTARYRRWASLPMRASKTKGGAYHVPSPTVATPPSTSVAFDPHEDPTWPQRAPCRVLEEKSRACSCGQHLFARDVSFAQSWAGAGDTRRRLRDGGDTKPGASIDTAGCGPRGLQGVGVGRWGAGSRLRQPVLRRDRSANRARGPGRASLLCRPARRRGCSRVRGSAGGWSRGGAALVDKMAVP